MRRAWLALALAPAIGCSVLIGLKDPPPDGDGGGEASADAPSDVTTEVVTDALADAASPDATSDPTDCGVTHAKCASALCVNGDCVRRLFVTSSATTAQFGGVSNADGVCNSLAATYFPNATFFAWLSEGDASAGSKLASSKAPFVLPDGTQVVAGSAALFAASVQTPLDHAINETEDGGPGATFNVWTGTLIDGGVDTANTRCNDWKSASDASSTSVGYSNTADEGWTDAYLRSCNLVAHFYCVEK